jgi:hypothetical protein
MNELLIATVLVGGWYCTYLVAKWAVTKDGPPLDEREPLSLRKYAAWWDLDPAGHRPWWK